MGKSLVPDPERAPLVRRAFDEYATGRFTKQEILEQATTWGLRNRRGRSLSSQAIGMLLRNQLYAGIVDVPEYGVRGRRGDFGPLIPEDLFYRVQAVLSGHAPSIAPRLRSHPDFPLRNFVRCESLRAWTHRQLVQGPQRVLRVLSLPPWLPSGQRDEGKARGAVHRRTRTTPANARLHAVTQGIRAGDLEGTESSCAR
ncbi:MAG: hypothetical protein GEU82_17235 [Luteitalea sp.]|nr:hypothetical protein [Luteitalea sp.]